MQSTLLKINLFKIKNGFIEIEDFFNIYKNAAWSKDKTSMINLYAKDAVIYDMWDQGFITDPEQWQKIIFDWFDSLGEEKVNVAFELINIHQSVDVGFANALISFQAISKDGIVLRSMKNRITLGFTKFVDGWKVIHQHTSAPISSERLSAILDI